MLSQPLETEGFCQQKRKRTLTFLRTSKKSKFPQGEVKNFLTMIGHKITEQK